MATVQVNDREHRIEDFSGRKALRASKLLKRVSGGVPKILELQATFVRNYEASNYAELDRAQARFEFPPTRRMLVDETTREPVLDEETGEPRWVVVRPGRVDHLTDADWEASGQKLKLPKSPSMGEQIAAVFPDAMDLAEEEVLKLLALCVMSNADVKRYSSEGSIEEKLAELGDDLLDGGFDELMELAVVAGEHVGDQYRRKVDALGDRLGNALRLFGMRPESLATTGSSSEKPTSSTSSDEPTDGESETPSTRPDGDSSELSETGSNGTPATTAATV